MKSHRNQNNQEQSRNYQNNQNYENNWNNSGRFQTNNKQVCRFWMRGNCFHGTSCRFDHPMSEQNPAWCRDGDNCLFWPSCKFPHPDMCRYQEHCSRRNCTFMHNNSNFLEKGTSIPAPNIHSHQDFPAFQTQKRRGWNN